MLAVNRTYNSTQYHETNTNDSSAIMSQIALLKQMGKKIHSGTNTSSNNNSKHNGHSIHNKTYDIAINSNITNNDISMKSGNNKNDNNTNNNDNNSMCDVNTLMHGSLNDVLLSQILSTGITNVNNNRNISSSLNKVTEILCILKQLEWQTIMYQIILCLWLIG